METTIVECARCGLLFPNPFPYPLEPQKLYGDPEKYFASHDLTHKIERYRQLAKEIRAHCSVADPRLLDIGAGRGDFLHAAKLEGFQRLLGLEFAEAMIAYAKDNFGVELRRNPAETLIKEGLTFAGIVLNAVLEHVYDPAKLIAHIAALSARGAVLYLDLPRDPHLLTMVGNRLNRALGCDGVYNLQPTWPPFHVFGFNPRALTTLLGNSVKLS